MIKKTRKTQFSKNKNILLQKLFVCFIVPPINDGYGVFVVRSGFHRTYNILLAQSFAAYYGLIPDETNHITTEIFTLIFSQATYAQLIDIARPGKLIYILK